MKPIMHFICAGIFLIQPVFMSAQQLVLRGDYPDPSVIRVGDEYWASATTSNWAPAYPLVKSKDLKNWNTVGHVFPELPDWADYYFWAPELSYDSGKFYVYYSAHKKGGNLCVAVASADKPEGPYKDHGPIICQPVGSIDAFPMRDENGKLHMIWKEDANSVRKPTPIWIAEMDEARTKLLGEKKELFRNDQSWEANLVEGVSMIREGEYYYAFYAAAGCCGAACTYGVGIARAKSLHGPWEKYAKNPVLTHSDQWKCPGHGTPVEKDGKHYFMYHGYHAKSNVFTGREALLIEYRFTNDGWIEFVKNDEQPAQPLSNVNDEFDSANLNADWQWSVFNKPAIKIDGGSIKLSANDSAVEAMLGHKIVAADYEAEVVIDVKNSKGNPGLTVIGDDKNMVMVVLKSGALQVVRRKDGMDSIVARSGKIRLSSPLKLRVQSSGGRNLQFSYVNGTSAATKMLNKVAIDGGYLPPWDRAVRVGLIVTGKGVGEFEGFAIRYGGD